MQQIKGRKSPGSTMSSACCSEVPAAATENGFAYSEG